MDSPAPALTRRTLRTYARREDAEQARAMLADHKIEAMVEEHFFRPDPAAPRVSGGCSLTVLAADAAEGTRWLLRMPPSETAGRPEAPAPPMARSPLRRRVGKGNRQRSPLPVILIAVFCSAAGIYWVVKHYLIPTPAALEVGDLPPENILVREDLNWDGGDDSVREYSPGGQLLSMQEDRDFDGKMDLRWTWQRGQLTYRDRDLDRDGIMDERTTFDGYNTPFYVDLRRQGKGPPILRRVFREGVLWKILEDKDADTHFDRIQEFSPEGVLFRDEVLPPDSPENGVPQPVALPHGPAREAALPMRAGPAKAARP